MANLELLAHCTGSDHPPGELASGCLQERTLLLLVQGELAAPELLRAERHIDGCRACRAAVSVLASAETALPSVGPAVISGAMPTRSRALSTLRYGESAPEPTRVRATTAGGSAGCAAPEPPRPGGGALAAGALLDWFRIIGPLGRGGMGEVYHALDTQLQRRVAIKVLHRELLQSPPLVRGFIREARTTARFNHPHIVTIHHVGTDPAQPFIAFEYLDGVTLREHMLAGPLPPPDCVDLTRAIAQALATAHAASVLHRDLKPENVMLPTDGRLRVLDFGLAAAANAARLRTRPYGGVVAGTPDDDSDAESDDSISLLSHHQGLRGTPAYMAPEQWCAGTCSVKTDIWALGVILCELLTGRRPYASESVDEQRRRVIATRHPEIRLPQELARAASTRGGALARALVELAERCVRSSPDERPHASEVVAELARLGGGLPRSAANAAAVSDPQATALVGTSPAPHRRTRLLRRLVLGGGLAVAGALALFYWAPKPHGTATRALASASPEPASAAPFAAPGSAASAGVLSTVVPAQVHSGALVAAHAHPGRQAEHDAAATQQLWPAQATALVRKRCVIRSLPSGASVRSAGRLIGHTPVAVWVGGSRRSYAVEQSGFERAELLTDPASPECPDAVALTPRPAQLTVVGLYHGESVPARLFVDSRPVDETPALIRGLAPGPHSVRLESDAFAAVNRQITISPGEQRRLVIELWRNVTAR